MKVNCPTYRRLLSCERCLCLLVATVAAALSSMLGTARAEIFVTNIGDNSPGSGTIGKYTLAGATVNAALVSGLTGPLGIAVSGGHLFVLDSGNGTVGKYTPAGATVNASLITGLSQPLGIAVSGTDLFVANFNTNTIRKYTTSGTTVNASLVTGLSGPIGIAVSGTDLFVVNASIGTIGKYTTSGATVNAQLVSGLPSARGIAVSGGNLFVTNLGNGMGGSGTIGKYTTSGATVNAALITGLNSPWGIAVSGTNLFVTNRTTNTIGKYTTAGATVNASLVAGQGLDGPWSIAVPEPLQLTAAVSRKRHGGVATFDINLPLTGEPAVECRIGGASNNYALVFTFNNNLASGGADLTGTGAIGSISFVDNIMSVNLTGVADVQKITVTLIGMTDIFSQVLPDTAVSMNMLIGDTNGNKTVNVSDVAQTKAQSGSSVTVANFRTDVNVSGAITVSDIAQVKANAGHSVP